jgi:hypothetical protein
MPPATAKPSTAAITGFDSRSRLGPIGAIESWPPTSRFFSGSPDATAFLQIGAGAKIPAGAGENGDRSVPVGIEGAERVVQLSCRRAVDGVAAIGTIDGNDGDGSIALDQYGVGHVRRPPCLDAVVVEGSFAPGMTLEQGSA